MANQDSILGLFDKLCHLQLNQTRAHVIQPKFDRDHHMKILKHKLFNTLFDSIREINSKKSNPTPLVRKEIDKILCNAFNLRLKRRFDEACRLELLLGKLLSLKENEITPVLCFISALVNTDQTTEKSSGIGIGQHEIKIPAVYSDPSEKACLPDGPLFYGDSRVQLPESRFYMHYPRQIFEVKEKLLKDVEINNRSVFDLLPGSSLSGNGLFNVTGYLNDEYEQKNTLSVFGALIQSKVTLLDVRLEFPDFTDDNYIPEINIPKVIGSCPLSEDEGYAKSLSSSIITFGNITPVEENIWEKALSYIPNEHYTWERIGCEPGLTEKPYLTEAGTLTFDQLWLHKTQQTCLLHGETFLPSRTEISQQCLIKDVLHVLLGVPSLTFPYNEDIQHFTFNAERYVSGYSPQSLDSYLKEFMECGSNYKKLEYFSRPLTIDSFYEAGLVFQAFTTAIRKVLQYYRGVIISISHDVSLMEVKYMCHRLFIQFSYLVRMCECRVISSEGVAQFPKGIELISYLYQETLEANSTDNYPMMLSILQTTCGPFTLFLQNWVYHGTFQDLYGEFTIQVNHRFLESRNRQYWSNSYALTTQNIKDCVPIFLSDLATDIIVCGKALNLLKLCSPSHFMCNVNDRDIPRVSITFSEEDLGYIDTQCQIYVSRMKEIARQVSLSRKEQQHRDEHAKYDLREKAHKIASGQLEQLQNILNSQKKAEDLKKRKEFERLKTQMNKDIQRRATKDEDAKTEDKKYMKGYTRREEALTIEEQVLEEQVKKELIAYYAELGEEAAKREQKALWKIRRARLDLERRKFLLEDIEHWKEEMDELRDGAKKLQEVEPELPRWASDSESSSPVSIISSLSKWKDKELVLPVAESTEEQDEIERDDDEDVVVIADTLKGGSDFEDNKVISDLIDGSEEVLDKADPFDADEKCTDNIDHRSQCDGKVSLLDLDKKVISPAIEDESSMTDVDEEIVKSSDITIEVVDPSHVVDIAISVDVNEASGYLTSTSEKTPVKTTVKMNESCSAASETESTPEKQHIKLFETSSASKETTELSTALSSVKPVGDQHASLETIEEDGTKSSIKFISNRHFSEESESKDVKSSIKINQGRHFSKESEACEESLFPKLKVGSSHASDETQQKEWKIKEVNIFGHSSEMSHTYRSIIPKLKNISNKHVSFETNFKDSSMKPRICISKTMSVNKRSDEPDAGPKIRKNVNLKLHPSKESSFVDEDKRRKEKFKEMNVFGHASDSSVQKLLYGGQINKDTVVATDLKQLLPQNDWILIPVEPYDTEFNFLGDFPKVDLMQSVPVASFGDLGDYGISQQDDIDKYKSLSLPSVLKKSMMAPLKAQISLVNKCIVDYFFVEMKLEEHFDTLRRYLLMEDGDFAEILSDSLLDKMATNPLPQEVLNPVFLNGVLKKSLQSSMLPNDKYADNLSFVLKFIPKSFNFISHDTLDCLELRYKVDWPVNIVLTEACMSKYGLVFSFMLQLKRIVWVLKDIWYHLKRDSVIMKAANSPQFRQLQLYRQEMQHFVKVMQGYIANQIIHVTWQEFHESLAKDVHDLDDLYKVHGQYIEKAVFRCLLNTKAKPVMKIIQDICSLILKFRTQLLTGSWKGSDESSVMLHSNFNQISASYQAFTKYSRFLFELVTKLAIRGYQPHLQELLLRLNFNNYYKDQ